jgi:hypothetical protein
MWWLFLAASLLQAAPDCELDSVVSGYVRLQCSDCVGRYGLSPPSKPMANATLRLESDGRVAEATTDHEGRFQLRNLPEGVYRVTMPGHKLVYAGYTGRIHIPAKGCTRTEISFSVYGPAEQMQDALFTARNYLSAAIELFGEWIR